MEHRRVTPISVATHRCTTLSAPLFFRHPRPLRTMSASIVDITFSRPLRGRFLFHLLSTDAPCGRHRGLCGAIDLEEIV